jgi:hypothetical protein
MNNDPLLKAESEAAVQHRLPMVLEMIKREAHEMANETADMIDLGVLRTAENAHLWQGAISRESRLVSGDITEAELGQAYQRLNGSFRTVAQGAPKRCIDGSTIEGYDDANAADYTRPLGPQVQGGIADEAYAQRLIKGFNPTENATLIGDIDAAAAEHSGDFAPGDHTDNHNEGNPDNTGCGAINGMRAKAELLVDEEAATYAKGVVDSILALAESSMPAAAYESLRLHAGQMLASPDYLPDQVGTVLDKIRDLNPNGVEKLVRPHNECSLTINFAPDTTFHRDHYNAATDDKIQNFNLDAWYITQEYGDEGYALVVDAVLTAMNLTDGSLQVFARVPKPIAEAVLTPVA